MEITGQQLIGGKWQAKGHDYFFAKNSATGENLSPRFTEATAGEVAEAVDLAAEAFVVLQKLDKEIIAGFLDEIARGIQSSGDGLIDRIADETALPRPRLLGERDRTVNQTKLFAKMVREGAWVQARIDRPDPHRTPLAKPDVRTMLKGIGPIVVFGASNFPLAISVAGTDTVAALAAGCPVIVKAHPAHPGTCEIISRIILGAIEKVGLPLGTFSMLQGISHTVGTALVEHPQTSAVAFTGSLKGGRALFDVASRRPIPIPVYAEMGSTNPVFVLSGAANERAEKIAEGYVQSVTLGVGQFCTNPGLLFIENGPAFDKFSKSVSQSVAASVPAAMLHEEIHSAFQTGITRLKGTDEVDILATSRISDESSDPKAACTIFSCPANVALNSTDLIEEVFGPSSIVLTCDDVEQMVEFARQMPGQLTATIHGTPDDLAQHTELVEILQLKVGRLIFNGFPTGIEVCNAIHHGGPYPATTHSHFTSIGPMAIYRFTKPVCFQNFPDEALPPPLRNLNTWQIPRVIDGKLSYEDV